MAAGPHRRFSSMARARTPDPETSREGRGRLLDMLESLLALPSAELASTLTHACDLVARALRADKVDAFVYDPSKETLRAIGVSNQPLSALQRRLGLDVLAVANGGRVVQVFQAGQTFMTGELDRDPEELRGIREGMKIRSQLGVPLEVGGERRGVIMVASLQPSFFQPDDARFAELVVRWVGMVAHRAELVEEISRTARDQGRQAAAEELVTALAHDMRNLLAPIHARLFAIQSRAAGQGRDEDARDAEAAGRTVQRLAGMIGNVLDNARLDQGMFQISQRPLSLVALCQDVARLMGTAEHPVNVEVVVETGVDLAVEGDGERLRQCLENLVANALRHSPRHVPVRLQVTRAIRSEGAWAQVIVRDEGPGIAADVLPHIFDRFTTGQPSVGLGLGLYLARRIVEAHGGRLSVESTPGQGARFVVELPALQQPT
jgi:two-component system, OmpR family, sensor kinase